MLGNAILDRRAVEAAFEQKTGGRGAGDTQALSVSGGGAFQAERTASTKGPGVELA